MSKQVRILSFILCTVLMLNLFVQGQQPVFGAETIILYQDDFETGTYTVADGKNDNNNTKQLLKDGQLQWTFEKTGGKEFTGYPTDLVASYEETVATVNLTKALNTTSAGKLADTIAWHNLANDAASVLTGGILTIDLRMKRPSTDTTSLVLYDAPISGYANRSQKVARLDFFCNSSSRGRLIYKNEYTSPTTIIGSTQKSDDNGLKMKAWMYLRLTVNIDEQTVAIQYSQTTKDKLIDWQTFNFYGNGSGPYSMANTVGAIAFEGNDSLAIDDIQIAYQAGGGNAPVASDVSIIGKPLLGEPLIGVYTTYSDKDGDAESGTTCTWSRADEEDFVVNVTVLKIEEIVAGGTSTYIPTEADLGKYIQFSVTPRNNAALANVGQEVTYQLYQPVRISQTVPIVSIIVPQDGSTSFIGDEIILTSSAACDLTTITKVEYYANNTKIGESDTEPYTFSWSNAQCGEYFITAKAYNALGESADSMPIRISVLNVSPIKLYASDGATELGDNLGGIESIKATALATNTRQTDLKLKMIIALYDAENKLIGTSLGSDLILAQNASNQAFEANMSLTDEIRNRAVRIKAFVWGTDHLTPYGSAFEKELTPLNPNNLNLDLYLLIGQSNMSGRATLGSEDKVPIDRAFLFRKDGEFEVARNAFNRYSTVEKEGATAKLNPGTTFVKKITQSVPTVQIGIISNARGGSSLNEWMKGTNCYNEAVRRTRDAMKYGKIKGIIWHQGASDTSEAKRAVYMDKLKTMVEDLRTDLGDKTIPFIAGELNTSTAERVAFNEMLNHISEHIPYSACVSAEGLTDIGDGSHFDAKSQRILGERYADEILKMNYGISQPDHPEGATNLSASATAAAIAQTPGNPASNAIDGNVSTLWVPYSTTTEQAPWLMLDLGDEYDITKIEIQGKETYDNQQQRKEFQVQASNTADFSTYTLIGAQTATPFPYKGIWSCNVFGTEKYRYIRIIKTVPDSFVISEVRVFGLGS